MWGSFYGHVMIVDILIECNASCLIQDEVSYYFHGFDQKGIF